MAKFYNLNCRFRLSFEVQCKKPNPYWSSHFGNTFFGWPLIKNFKKYPFLLSLVSCWVVQCATLSMRLEDLGLSCLLQPRKVEIYYGTTMKKKFHFICSLSTDSSIVNLNIFLFLISTQVCLNCRKWLLSDGCRGWKWPRTANFFQKRYLWWTIQWTQVSANPK